MITYLSLHLSAIADKPHNNHKSAFCTEIHLNKYEIMFCACLELQHWPTPVGEKNREALPKRGTFFRLLVYERVGIHKLEYTWVGKTVIGYLKVPFKTSQTDPPNS